MLSEAKKISMLIKVMVDRCYLINEMSMILNRLNPLWITFNQSELEIASQLGREYGLWRGLGNAIFNYLKWEKEQVK